jgi:hypothetical protein
MGVTEPHRQSSAFSNSGTRDDLQRATRRHQQSSLHRQQRHKQRPAFGSTSPVSSGGSGDGGRAQTPERTSCYSPTASSIARDSARAELAAAGAGAAESAEAGISVGVRAAALQHQHGGLDYSRVVGMGNQVKNLQPRFTAQPYFK